MVETCSHSSGTSSRWPILGNFDPPAAIQPTILTNASNPLDINDDGAVSPLDALFVINYLNDRSQVSPGTYPDANADGVVAPIDALLVINALNGVSQSVTDSMPNTHDIDSNTPSNAASSFVPNFGDDNEEESWPENVDRTMLDWDSFEIDLT